MKFMPKIALFLSVVLTACSEEIDLTAPYEETMVVYGFLNPNASEQYIRVSKAFLGDGNVYTMAAVYDSVNYADVLDVTLERIVNGSVSQTFSLSRVDTIPKDSGTFAYPGQVFYKLTQPILDDGSKYRIRMVNTQTGYTATAVADIIPDVQVITPSPTTDAEFALGTYITYRFRPTEFSYIHDMQIVFRYSETDPSGNLTFHEELIEFPERIGVDDLQSIDFRFYRPSFYEQLGANLEVKPGVVRRVDNLPNGQKPVEFRFYSGTEEFYTYYQLTKPSTGVVQERPLYTNIDNGVGLFTSRMIHSEYRDLSGPSKAAFDTSAYTSNLGFQF